MGMTRVMETRVSERGLFVGSSGSLWGWLWVCIYMSLGSVEEEEEEEACGGDPV